MNGKLDVVRKLLAKASGAATPEEAETYTAKAVELMARHGIDAAMLAVEEPGTDTIGQRRIPMDDPYSKVKAQMLGWLARAMRCRAVMHRYPGGDGRRYQAVTLFGFESDRERVELLYTSLLLQATAQLTRLRAPWHFDGGVAAYRRSWLYGFAVEVSNRVEKIEAQVEQEATSSDTGGTPGTALVLADRKSQVDRAYKTAFSNLGKAPRTPTIHGSAYAQGVAAGQRADLGQRRVDGSRRRELG